MSERTRSSNKEETFPILTSSVALSSLTNLPYHSTRQTTNFPLFSLSIPFLSRLGRRRLPRNNIVGERIIIIVVGVGVHVGVLVLAIESARIAAFIRFPPPLLYFCLPGGSLALSLSLLLY